ncbi:hypothetical protein A2641_01480 [Candidatus Nomurabacteria bacterium RIFCSPHIGHO2_01_FULL_37_25]|uniref:Peptidoglycan binding-like domain-containing protein n=1 Tax=Candidatus Nomurabacteria bacterium RIFCSPLOWO2_01_FULL_36_16 TaxID=1801767 RepID=A0A1F6WZ06_9BACT|nr:MAG: hypothetical protein A2641_01480 [Candidatus Nomurabacteria bacterium RIFCSPHIGHO2_01_FULL_37_25]OGI75382.1 MAG: hypothetical protein A3D36_02380 [Candidatus Nomurabacteria bacterium RIFCSPHIGHO2_02_FULL_36_29]OGI87129.1 MAG: hypothetical protein A3A91_00475 [Candidatus Nomurabacteria bacterium RIFCSPLOWO2_01_FULL_36_16]
MKRLYPLFLVVFLFSFKTVFAVSVNISDCAITSTLRLGSRGSEVMCLQDKLKLSSVDGIFGPLTKIAVKAFQSSKGLVVDGIVGPLSSKALGVAVKNSVNYPVGCTSTTGYSPTTGIKCDGSSNLTISNPGTNNSDSSANNEVKVIIPKVQPPKVFSVSPEKVRSGDIVKIYGENFSLTGNTVRLRYGHIEARFENLSSSDGKVISFVFQPPEVKTMNKEELLDLPSTALNKILDPIKAAGGSIDDILIPYRNMKNEDDLRQFLNNNGHNFDELYGKFYVTIENVYGQGSSDKAILAGLRKLSFGSNLVISEQKNFLKKIFSLLEVFAPRKAYALLGQGGVNSGIITECTCGPGYITFMTDNRGVGTNFYWWAPGYVPRTGNPVLPGPNQLGWFIPNVAQCWMEAGPICFPIVANVVGIQWGQWP